MSNRIAMKQMIRNIEKRIARMADRAIWRPKLEETFLIPNEVACAFVSSVCWIWLCSFGLSDFVRIWKLL